MASWTATNPANQRPTTSQVRREGRYVESDGEEREAQEGEGERAERRA